MESWLTKWKMKILIEKSCYMIFTKSTRDELNLDLKIYGNNLKRQDTGKLAPTSQNTWKFIKYRIFIFSTKSN